MNYENLEKTNSYFCGDVVKGNQIGRIIGFPTANLQLRSGENFPTLNGVYSVIVHYKEKKLLGVMNIGKKPTFEKDSKTKIFEVHILNFNEDIYGETLKVEICNFIRKERKFDSVEALKKQIMKDCTIAKEQLEQKQHFTHSHLENFNQEVDLSFVHLPDLTFVRFCEEKFGINRGVYNTIDKWFAEHHRENVIFRRITIINFLYWVTLYVPREGRVEFGAKGLSEQLIRYNTDPTLEHINILLAKKMLADLTEDLEWVFSKK